MATEDDTELADGDAPGDAAPAEADPSGDPSDEPDNEGDTEPDNEGDEDGAHQPSWWHRDHPTFTSLSGFFTGLAVVIVVPGIFAAILGATFDNDTAEGLFPFVLVIFAVPLGLLAVTRTRRFGRYMLIGMVSTAIVVVGVSALVLWILIMMDA